MSRKERKERIVLITNLLDVSIETGFGLVNTHSNALVISDWNSGGPRYRLHGYRNEVGNPTFDMVIPSFEWSIEPHPAWPGMPPQAVQRRFALRFAGKECPPIELYTDFANDLPLDIERVKQTDLDEGRWGDLLFRKVLRYYHAPYIVLGQQHEADRVREALGVEGVSPG